MKQFLFVFLVVLLFSVVNVYGQETVAVKSEPGFINIAELDSGIGLGDTSNPYSKYFCGITDVFAYQINKNFVIGIGTGVLAYNGGVLVPFYLATRYIFDYSLAIKKFVLNPYLFGDGGFLLSFSDFNGKTRMFANPGIGARLSITEKLAASLGAGMVVQMGNNISRDCYVNFKLGITYLFGK
jgi:hypothetical protein